MTKKCLGIGAGHNNVAVGCFFFGFSVITKSSSVINNSSYHLLFTRECNETSIAGGEKALTHSLTRSLDFVSYFIYGNYNVS